MTRPMRTRWDYSIQFSLKQALRANKIESYTLSMAMTSGAIRVAQPEDSNIPNGYALLMPQVLIRFSKSDHCAE